MTSLAFVTLATACRLPAAEPTPTPAADAAATPSPASTPTPAEDSAGGTLRVGISEPDAIVPHEAVAPDELLVVDALFDSLTRYAHNLVPVPAAAASWSHNEDATEWTFLLREDATFHDGSPVTARDFRFAWETAVREGAAGFHLRDVEGYEELAQGQVGSLRGVDVVDDLTLRVTLSRPHGQFPAIVAHPALGPLPRELWRGDPAAFRDQPVGNGPFAAAEARVPGRYIRLHRAPAWRNGTAAAHLDEVLFQVMDPETAFVAFQQGRLQVSPLPDGAADAAIERFGESADGYLGPGVLRGVTPSAYVLGFNVTAPPFDDAAVRRAVSLAIDRDAIAEEVMAGGAVPADALVPPGLDGTPGRCEACRHDPDEAAALLADRGVEDLTLWFNRDGGHGPVAERVRADLEGAGVRAVSFETPGFGDYLDALAAGEAGFFRYGWRPEYPVADDFLRPLFHSAEIGEHNFMHYARDDVDALIDGARASTTTARRRFLVGQAEELIMNRDQAVVPIMWYRHATVVADDVVGFRLDAMGHANLHEVSLARR